MRLAIGSGLSGLVGPRPVQIFSDGMVFIRPLLNWAKNELSQALQGIGMEWREDGSNATGAFCRNRMRNSVIPAWQAAEKRNVHQGAARCRELLEEDDEALTVYLERLLPRINKQGPCNFSALRGEPRAIWRRALHRWLALNCCNQLTRKGFEVLLGGVCRESPLKLSVGQGLLLVHQEGWLSVEKKTEDFTWQPILISADSRAFLPNGHWVSTHVVSLSNRERQLILEGRIDPKQEAWLSWDPSSKVLCKVRQWMPGDRWYPLGAPGKIKVQDSFTNRKLPKEQRHRLPLICHCDGEILWIPGFPPSHAYRLKEGTSRAVQLKYC